MRTCPRAAGNKCKVETTQQCGPLPHSNIRVHVPLENTHVYSLFWSGSQMGVWPAGIHINVSVEPNTIYLQTFLLEPNNIYRGRRDGNFPKEGHEETGGTAGFCLSRALSTTACRRKPAAGDAAPRARHLGKAIPVWGFARLTPRSPDPPDCDRVPPFPPAQRSPSLSPTFRPRHATPETPRGRHFTGTTARRTQRPGV